MKRFPVIKTALITLAVQLFFTFPMLLKAQSKATAKRFVTIDLIVQDTSMLKNFYLQFEMCKDDVNSNYNTQDADVYKFKIVSDKTQIKVPLSTQVNYGRIECAYDNQVRLQPFYENGLSVYIFEQDDHIKLIISKKTIRFEGENAEKYNCIQMINSSPIYDGIQENILAEQNKYKELFELQRLKVDSAFNTKKHILKQSKLKLSPEIYSLILADCQGYYYSSVLGILKRNIAVDAQKKSIIIKYFNQWFAAIDVLGLDKKTLVKSYRFCDFLFNQAQYGGKLSAQTSTNQKTTGNTFSQLYDYIQKNHTGLIKDKITYLTFSFLMVYKNGRPYLETAYKQMSDNVFKKSLSDLKANYKIPIYEFELLDQYGKLRKISEFKGKLIVFDFWFTGCYSCAKLAEELKPIMLSYRGNNNVEFISISIDTKREEWLNSVNKETYSHKDQINLFTNGLSGQHPMISNYRINSFPTLFLISKEGEIITTTMPRPIKGMPETALAFKKLIDNNL